jgi:RND family efflux transporter MFP subunit
MKTGGKIAIAAAIVVVIGVIVVLNLRPKKEGLEADLEVAARKAMVSKVTATGELKAQSQVSVQPQLIGEVTHLYVKEGDKVRKGQVVCELDRSNYQTGVELSRIAVEQLKRTLVRTESLYHQHMISDEGYEQVKLQFDNAVTQQQQAQDQLDKTVITAPVSGRVIQLNVKEGEMAIAGMTNISGAVMMVIANLDTMLALVDADETDVPSIRPGQKATLTLDAFTDTTFTATVNRVGYMPIQTLLTATEKSTKFEVELRVDQPTEAMRPGMSVTTDIITSQRDSILSVPIQAVGRRKVKGEETQTVFVVKDGKAHLTPVKTGISSDVNTELLDGISVGDTVVTGPYKVLSKLKDGDKVHGSSGETKTGSSSKPDSIH